MAVILPSFPSSSSSSFLFKSHKLSSSIPNSITLVFPSMEMYNNGGSSFGASLTLQTPNTFRDVSFSSYLNQSEEHMIRKLTNQPSDYCKKTEEEQQEEELSVFGAEKYFKGEIEDVESKIDQRFIDNYDTINKMHLQEENIEQSCRSFSVKRRTSETNTRTSSVRSTVSCNSRIGLLNQSKLVPRIERGSKTRTFLSNFGCNCINKKSTQITEKRIAKSNMGMFDFDSKTVPLSSKLTERTTRNDYFTFPVLNLNDLNSNSNNSNSLKNSNSDRSNLKFGNLAGKVVGDNNPGRLSLGRKLSLLHNWDVDIPTEDEMYIPSSGMYNNDDVDSDSSSDLFEIESFSMTGNNSFVAPRKSESNCYAPSEVSVDWSVVTASAADFSVVSDYEEMRTGGAGGWRISGGNGRVADNKEEQKKWSGILSGCANHKAVRVAGGEYKVGGGPAGGRRRLSDSVAVGSLFRGGMI